MRPGRAPRIKTGRIRPPVIKTPKWAKESANGPSELVWVISWAGGEETNPKTSIMGQDRRPGTPSAPAGVERPEGNVLLLQRSHLVRGGGSRRRRRARTGGDVLT